MKFIHRLGFYLGGFAIGLVILAFFLSGKKASCDYSPDARVLKDIRTKDRAYTEAALVRMQELQIDSSEISRILSTGDVDFSRSQTRLDSCKLYLITGHSQSLDLELLFENCDSTATLQEVTVQ